jgi:hypothetical protein
MRSRRANHLLAAVASAVLVCTGLAVGAQPYDPGPGAQTPGRGEDCVPTGPIRTVTDINRFIDATAGVPEFLGADVGVDVRLADRRSSWHLAATLRSPASGDGDPWVRNSMLVLSAGCARVVVPPDGGAIVPDRADGVGYWPMSGWWRGPTDAPTVYVMLQRVAEVPGTGFGFVTLGPAVALFDVTAPGPPRLRRQVDLGADDRSSEAPEWGAAATLHRGWLYLYGTSTRALPGIHGFALRVARVRPLHVTEQERWRYWDGTGWRADPRAAVPLIAELGGVSQTLSVWRQDGHWYVLSKQDEFLGRQIVVWPGETPAGPFGPPVAVADLPCDAETGELRYMPLAHPGLLPEPGTVVVSYSRNLLSFAAVCATPSSYRPHFVRVVLP